MELHEALTQLRINGALPRERHSSDRIASDMRPLRTSVSNGLRQDGALTNRSHV